MNDDINNSIVSNSQTNNSTPIDGTNNTAPTPSFPSSLEGPSMEVFPVRKAESIKAPENFQAPAETLLTPETIPTPEPVQIEKPIESVPQPVIATPPTPVIANVVDKRTNDEVLTAHLNSSQPLTIEADEDEKEFIEHVEELHKSD